MIKYILAILLFTGGYIVGDFQDDSEKDDSQTAENKTIEIIKVKHSTLLMDQIVTAYNTVAGQTDGSPCIAASGDDICGRDDVAACPRRYQLGTIIEIDGRKYECLDRTALKFDGRFDISFDKDVDGAKAWGKKITSVKIYE